MQHPHLNVSRALRWLVLLVVGVAVIAFARYYVLVGAPSPAEVEAAIPGTALAWDVETSLVVFQLDRRVYFDRVIVDRSPHLNFPSLPRWRVGGDWFSIPARATQLASAGIAPRNVGCRCAREGSDSPVHVFGAVWSDEVAFIALQVDGVWKRYPVSAPGFIIQNLDAPDSAGIRLQLLRQDGSLIDEIIGAKASG